MGLRSSTFVTTIVAYPFVSAITFFLWYIVAVLFIRQRRTQNLLPFPPGPKPLPFIGNLHQLPLQKPFLTFAQWSKTYSSPIIGLRLGSQPAVVLNTWRAVRDLFDQRGGIYSSRPFIPLVEYVVPGPYHVAFMPYDKNWRRGRAALVSFLQAEELKRILPIQQAESTQMIFEILEDAENYEKHVLRAFCAVILESVYGVRGKRERTDQFFRVQDEWAGMLDMGAMPPLDVFPWLKYVPSILTPWPDWRSRASSLSKEQRAFYQGLFAKGKDMAMRGVKDSFLAKLLEKQEKEGFSDVDLVYIASFLIEAGADTTAVALLVFIIAMAAHPEVQESAQIEVDAVFGDKVPENIDNVKLPYLRAIFWEVLRWRPSFPTSLPHATSKDDTYEGYFIPSGSTVLMNTWAIHHNEEDYPNANTFDPTRFLVNEFGTRSPISLPDDAGRKPTYAFGAGRRVCAGQEMAQHSLLLSMAKMVWTFNMSPKNGTTLDTSLVTGFKDAILTGPKHVGIEFLARSELRRNAIRDEWQRVDAFLSKFE